MKNMDILWIGLLLVFSDALLLGESLHRNETDESRLNVRLFSRPSDKFSRPVYKNDDAVQLEISLALIGLEKMDEQRQVMSSNVWLRQKWTDPFLQWTPSEFNNLKQYVVSTERIWVPDLVPHNSMSDSYTWHHDSLAKLSNTGEIVWITQNHLDTFCYMDLSAFPYDEHNCTIKFGSWAYHGFQVNISHWGEAELDLDYGSPTMHQTWEIVARDVRIHSEVYGCCVEPFQDISASVKLRRRTSYVTAMFVVPALIFVLLVPAVFMLPADSANKFILGTGILLSQVLLLLMLAEFLQSAYSTIPKLGVYYLAILVLVALSLGVSAFVANLWNRSRRRSVGVPGMIRVVLLKGFGRMLCVQYEDFLSAEPITDQDTDTISTNLDTVSNSSMNPLDGAKMIREYNSHVVNRAEWRQLAAILDRIFCVVFLVISVLIATAIIIKY